LTEALGHFVAPAICSRKYAGRRPAIGFADTPAVFVVGVGDKNGGMRRNLGASWLRLRRPRLCKAAALPQRAFQAPSVLNCGVFVFTQSPALRTLRVHALS